jgi:hypothetical protein
MQNKRQIIQETLQRIIENEAPRPAAGRARRENRGKRRFVKPTPQPKKSTSERAALLAAIEDGDKTAILSAIRRLRASIEQEND